MLAEQLTRDDDIIGRLLALDAVAKKDDQKSLDALAERLANDPHYGVRVAAARELSKKNTPESLDKLIAARDQDDARVRLAVIEGIARFYRPQAQRVLMATLDTEHNPLIVAAALGGLGKYGGDAIEAKIEEAMTRESFGNVIATAAIKAAGDLAAEELRSRVLRLVKANVRDYADRDGSAALGVIAKLYSTADDKTPAREFFEQCLHDESRRLRGAAIRALGTLGDSRALPALRAESTSEGMGRDVNAAAEAIKKLEQSSPLAPKEVVELRKLVSELQKSQQQLEEQIEQLGKQKAAKQSADDDSEAEDDDE
jgi:aminopeptidase N